MKPNEQMNDTNICELIDTWRSKIDNFALKFACAEWRLASNGLSIDRIIAKYENSNFFSNLFACIPFALLSNFGLFCNSRFEYYFDVYSKKIGSALFSFFSFSG